MSSEPGIIKGTFLSEDLMKREALGSSPNQSRPFSASTDAEGQHALVVLGEDVEPLGGEAACPECLVQVALGCPGTEYPGSRDLAASCVGKMLTVRLKTKYGLPTQEDWARSHFGPIVIGESFSQISLYLPGNRVLAPGLPEFAWSGSRESWQFGLGPSSSLHLPLVLALHPNNQWMMLWLETDRPGEQVLSPGACLSPALRCSQLPSPGAGGQALLTWTVMGGPLKIHLLTQPTLGQLLKKMQTLFFKDAAPKPPPSWTLGYHLCRSVGEDPSFRQNFFIKPMLDEGIPFDSDCIDDQLFDSAFHWKKISPMYSVDDIVNDLTSNGKDFILPLMIQTRSRDDQTDEVLCESMDCIVLSRDNTTSVLGQLVYNSKTKVDVNFPDPVDPRAVSWIETGFNKIVFQI